MPFFQRPLSKDLNNKRSVTLQVRIPLELRGLPGKRVLSSASIRSLWCVRPLDCLRMGASITVEAALALPLFLFAVMILMMPMVLMNESRKIQSELELVCAEISQYAGVLSDSALERGDYEKGGIPEELMEDLTKTGFRIYAEGKIRSRIRTEKAGHFSLTDSRILEDGETIDLILRYEMYLPFPVFRIKSVPMTARSCRRAWIGRTGGKGNGNSGQAETDELVYVGKSSTRYHRDRNCHYLYNHISVISFADVESVRNSDGRKYKPCARCGSQAGQGSSVYIMPSGESYHSDRNCSSIIAYVRAVPLSEAEYLGPCSYCAE